MKLSRTGEALDILIVGAGFNGLYQLYHLREKGFSVLLVDAGSDLGGTWYWNRYPGARVDSHVPNYEFSFAGLWQGFDWSEKFPSWEELRRYFNYVDQRLDLKKDIRFDTRVTAARFNSDAEHWLVQTEPGQVYRTRHLILCTGFAAKSYTPDFKGLDDFKGDCYHTAHWPEQAQGFAGKRVGVIGTGASGVQVIQEASMDAAALTVFQRTPILALPMRQCQLNKADNQLAKNDYWSRLCLARKEHRQYLDIIPGEKSWFEVSAEERDAAYEETWARGGFHFWCNTFADEISNLEVNRATYNFWRDKTRARINDPVLAEKLAPTEPPHPFGTKRPSLEQWYYEVFNQDNVSLVDIREQPILEITEGSVLTPEVEYPLDLLVLATGFDALTGGLTQIDVQGTDGVSLAEKWSDGVKNHLGMAVARFPNMFILYGPLAPAGLCTGPVCAEMQGEWLVNCLLYMRERQLTHIEATCEAEDNWVQHVREIGDTTLFPLADSWYTGANIPGKTRQLLNHPNLGTYLEFCDECAAAGYSGFELR